MLCRGVKARFAYCLSTGVRTWLLEPETKTDQPLRVLVVEGAKSYVALLLLALREEGFQVNYEAVATQAAMRAALMDHQWDVIISDDGMPQFRGQASWP
jgi:PleD family two-component response regulator